MKLFFGIVGFGLYLYLLIVLARVIVEMTRQFARSWRPAGVAAIGIEIVYVATDPPMQALRRMVPAGADRVHQPGPEHPDPPAGHPGPAVGCV